MVSIVSLGIGGHAGFLMMPLADQLRAEGYDISLHCADSSNLDENLELIPDFLRKVRSADILFVNVHGDVSYFRHFGALLTAVESSGVPMLLFGCEEAVVLQYRRYFLGSDEDYSRLVTYQTIGGDDNQRSTLIWALRNYDHANLALPDPVKPMAQGVYVPGVGGMTFEEGLVDVGKSGKPVIGILFVNVFFTRHNTDAIDSLWKAVEAQGGEPLAFFAHSYENELSGSIGLRRIVDEHLVRNGKPIIDALLNTMGFSLTLLAQPGCGEQNSIDNFFERLNVPIIQAVNLQGSRQRWKDSPFGLTPAEIAYCVSSPEFDGQIDAPPYCGTERTEAGDYRQVPIEERCGRLAEMAVRWARLRHTPESRKKVAILIYMYPPRQDLAGGGYGLDTMQSLVSMLSRLKDAGYSLDWVPKDGKEMVDRLLDGVTNDDNWKSDIQLRDASVDLVSRRQYEKWFSEISESARKRFVEAWGEPPGDIHVLGDNQLLPGILNGNVFIGFQPDRGKTTAEAYHDPWTAPPHQYLGFYRWLRDVWGADAVIHVGTHGTLEWLPGKSVALSDECDPDTILGTMPNINPYIIDNPGEGMQSKRRQYAVTTTHMIPAMARAGGYDEIDEVVTAVQQYLKTKDTDSRDKIISSVRQILELCGKYNLSSDLGLSPDCSVDEMDAKVDRLYDYLLEVKEAMIKDGLHILGEVPEGERLCETIYSLTRSPNDVVPSLRDAVAAYRGYDMGSLLKDPSGTGPDGKLNGELVESIDGQVDEFLHRVESVGFDREMTQAIADEMFPDEGGGLSSVSDFICGFLIDAVRRMTDEVTNILRCLDGEYIRPGPSGCPGRGRATILPTGRNFYSIDSDGVPWHSSWDIGSEMAEAMVRRYVEDNGTYPDTVGVVLWATDTMKTGGDDVAYILRLMGLRPVWTGYGGRVKDLEVIPLQELGRPRIDVTVRISGLFRDTFPNLSNMIDRGVQIIAALDEDDDANHLAANVRRDTVEALERGLPVDQARREASLRVFGDAPGQYGNGISDAITTGEWRTVDDLGEIFVRHGCYVYGRGLQGESRPEMFRRRLGTIDVTVKNHNTRAVDMLDMDDDFDSLGGFTAAVTSVRGRKPVSYMGDSSDTRNLRLRTTEEECRFIFRSKINNPKWLDGLRQHGFEGAKELSKLFDFVMGWSGTSDIIENWMYDDLASNFVTDDDVREWIKDENPYAMMAMLARLQEAQDRGFWTASDEMRERLKDIYLEFEERIEEVTDR
ncbi:MAG: cobaltochelatase subunit CobN [archaeon]|nr:cobaltochelatase subunit CobN [archaeon]